MCCTSFLACHLPVPRCGAKAAGREKLTVRAAAFKPRPRKTPAGATGMGRVMRRCSCSLQTAATIYHRRSAVHIKPKPREKLQRAFLLPPVRDQNRLDRRPRTTYKLPRWGPIFLVSCFKNLRYATPVTRRELTRDARAQMLSTRKRMHIALGPRPQPYLRRQPVY